MIKNYLKVALRHLFRNKGFSFINIAGLAIGISSCLIILIFVQQEISYDQFHSKKERIFRLNKIVTPKTGGTEKHAISSGKMGPTLAADYPEVEQSLRLLPWFDDILMIKDEQKLKISDVVFADTNFFDFFNFSLLQGDPQTALKNPQSIILTEETSQKFFGDQNPIGQTIAGFQDLPYQVTGVIENPPHNTHLRFNALISWSSTVPGIGALNWEWMNNWITQASYTYLLLNSPKAVQSLEPKLTGFMKKYMPTRVEQYQLYLQPMTDIHLKSAGIQYSRNLNLGNMVYVTIFSVSAFLILLIACINFINLTTARAFKRAREVGMRKVLGAVRLQLSGQFLGESILLTIFSLIIAVVLVEFSTPLFERLVGYEFQLELFSNSFFILGLLGTAVLVGLLSGVYPSFFLSGFQPVKVLRGNWKGGNKGATPRKVLVTVQFAVSIILILATIVIHRQIRYVQTKNMGFQKDQIIVLPIGVTKISEKPQTFKQEILQNPQIINAAGSENVPGSGTMGFGIIAEGKPENENWQAEVYPVDYDFLDTYKMEMAEGRYFSREFETDADEAVIINQSLKKSLGWENALGKRLLISGETSNTKVIGVIKDFNFESLHHPIGPLVLYISPERTNSISIRVKGNNIQSMLGFLKEKWQAFESKYPFEFYFLDKEFEKFYQSETRMMQTVGIFAFIAILIACLGIFGLTSFTVEQRTIEIGIRKVLGAPVINIFVLLSKDIFKLILIAMIISLPVAYYFIQKWLSGFAYNTRLSWWLFPLAGFLALSVAFLTVSTQVSRAAVRNPVDSIRYE